MNRGKSVRGKMHRGVANLLGPILGVSKELFKGCLVIHSKYFDLTTNLAPSFSKNRRFTKAFFVSFDFYMKYIMVNLIFSPASYVGDSLSWPGRGN